MRVTNGIIRHNTLTTLQTNLQRIYQAQEEVSTTRRIRRMSDDPLGAAEVVRTGSSINALAQYKRNVDSASTRLVSEEGVLSRLGDTLTRAMELGLAQGGATANQQTRLVAKAEVDQLLDFARQLGNTRHQGEYLFGGFSSSAAPFPSASPPFAPAVPAGTRTTEVGSGQLVALNHDGNEVFLSSNVLQSLYDLSDALGKNDPTAIQTAIGSLDGAFNRVQSLIGDVGARTQQLEVASANIDALNVQLRALKSQIEDADMEQAITELVTRQTTYQAAMLATSRVIGLNLADYLR